MGGDLVSPNDLVPISDVLDMSAPMGVTKKIAVGSLNEYSAMLNINKPNNGLMFDALVPGSDINNHCYAEAPSLGTDYTISARISISPYPKNKPTTQDKVIVGATDSVINSAGRSNSAYIGVNGIDLVFVIGSSRIVYPSFLIQFSRCQSTVTLTRSSDGEAVAYVNAIPMNNWPTPITSFSGTPIVNNGYYILGGGVSNQPNLDMVVYEASVYGREISPDEAARLYTRKNPTTGLRSWYRSRSISDGPTQWLDSVGGSHFLLPLNGSKAMNPDKEFHLRFHSTSSGYLGNGTHRAILPVGYVLNNCFMYSNGSTGLSLGTDANYFADRVAATSTSDVRTSFQLLLGGEAHESRSIYVKYDSFSSPCTFSFDGYITEYGESHATIVPPTVPINLSITNITTTSFLLSWSPSTSQTSAVGGYDIFDGGVKIGETSNTSFSVTGLIPRTAHDMTVKAFDLGGVRSESSNVASATTLSYYILLQDDSELLLQDGTYLLLQA